MHNRYGSIGLQDKLLCPQLDIEDPPYLVSKLTTLSKNKIP